MSTDLSQTQEWVLDLAEDAPELSYATIAEQTGTHTALVRDLVEGYEEDNEESGSTEGPTTVVDRITGTRAAVLQLAASNPGLSNAELAERADTHTAVVRDLRSSVQTASLEELLRNPDLTNAELAEATGTHTALVRDLRDDIRTTVLEYTLRNPDLTNAQVAEELGTHTAVVRDARKAYADGIIDIDITAEDEEDGGSTSEGPTTVVDNITDTRAAALQRAANDSDLTNRQIAEATGTHTAVVRDLRSNVQMASLERMLRDPDRSNAEIAEATGTHTALVRDLRADVRTTILEYTLRNPDMTNAEIAEELDTHTALVRDVRREYEDGVDDIALSTEDDAATTGTDGGLDPKVIALVVGALLLVVVLALVL